LSGKENFFHARRFLLKIRLLPHFIMARLFLFALAAGFIVLVSALTVLAFSH
jgi:hypothetical protein